MKHTHQSGPKCILLMLFFASFTLGSIHAASAQVSSSTTVAIMPSENTPRLDQTISINITISNVQNLYGLDVTLDWNASALQFLNADLRLGVESHPDGVLHEIPPYANIEVVENNASQDIGEYTLVATSVADAPPFSGSGNIATISFKVTGSGHSQLNLATQLADYNPSGSNFIAHTDLNGSVNSTIPEFPTTALLTLLLIFATIVGIITKKLQRKNSPASKSRLAI